MSPEYLSDIVPSTTRRYSSRNANSIPLVRVNNKYFMNTFPSTITVWNKLDLSIRNSTSLNIFKGRLLQFVRPLENSVFTCHNPIGIKYLTRLRLDFGHLRYYKFKHGFLDAVDPLCSCSTAIENTVYSFLHCAKVIQAFLYGNPTYSVNENKLIFDASIKYILETKRFDDCNIFEYLFVIYVIEKKIVFITKDLELQTIRHTGQTQYFIGSQVSQTCLVLRLVSPEGPPCGT